MNTKVPFISIKNLSKDFSGVQVLDNISLDIKSGACHVLAGENGAGKSTLIKIICGNYLPSSGSLILKGEPYSPKKPSDSIAQGIRAVYQELNLLPHLSVAENIFFDNLPTNTLGFLERKQLHTQATNILETLGLSISPTAAVSQLGIAQMQLIEIAKALSRKAKLLILDEPTATLTPKEIEKLFVILKQLKSQGVTLIYISHRLNELKEIGDDITILRNGQVAKSAEINTISTEEIIEQMIGRKIEQEYPPVPKFNKSSPLFEVKHLSTPVVKSVSVSVGKGEIVGIAGLVGSGRSELLRAIFGADPCSGSIFINGKEERITSPRKAVELGLSFITEDRKNQGLVLDFEIFKNISLTSLKNFNTLGFLNQDKELTLSEKNRQELNIKSSSSYQHARFLSGGNQQKVIFAKWLNTSGNIILLDEPTRGIDVGAKYEIYSLLNKLSEQGKAILVVSSDIHELMGICHRIMVMSNGQMSGELNREAFDAQELLSLSYKNYLS